MANKYKLAWDKIFEIKNFDLAKDLHFISATEIKQITGIEPRHMGKIDSTNDLADSMIRNGYFVLPVKNGEYAIVRGKGYHELEKLSGSKTHVSRVNFNLGTMHRNTSEMQYLDYSQVSGAIEDLIGEGALYPTIRGRERSGQFSFNVGNQNLNIDNVQVEVDLGLEGEKSIVLFEAKSKTPKDFIIRQLYYPYRRFKNLSSSKKIIPIFFTYDAKENAYNYWVYEFENLTDYNSIKLSRVVTYNIYEKDSFDIDDLTPLDESYVDLIPQANDLDKVQELVFKINEGANNAKDISEHFGFDLRQSSYYREAAEALGLVESSAGVYYLTDKGKQLVGLNSQDRNLYFARNLMGFNIVRQSIDLIKSGQKLDKHILEQIIANNSSLSGSTIPRRASSLSRWLKWISDNTGAINY